MARIVIFQHEASQHPGRLGATLRDHGFKLDVVRLDLTPDEGGMHLVAKNREGAPADAALREAATRAGVETRALSDYFLGAPTRSGLLLGYAAVPEAEIDAGVARLAEAFAAAAP